MSRISIAFIDNQQPFMQTAVTVHQTVSSFHAKTVTEWHIIIHNQQQPFMQTAVTAPQTLSK